ncbi:MAG: transporter permease [Microbacteriaceae bacterium]|nr:transporter permease [Microbacteriaceae bacterium]
MALIGIILVAFNLRTGVAAISPITAQIGRDIPLDSITLGIIGAVPPLAFAISGFFTGFLAKRVGLERMLVIALVVLVAGHVLRAIASGAASLVFGSIVALLAAGVGNVLLPPAVKRYFPDRVGLVTAVYVTLLGVSSAIPAIVAAPLADSAGWRFSLVVWAAVAAIALVPWVSVLLQHRRERQRLRDSTEAGDETPEIEEPAPALAHRIWRSGTAWTLAALIALSSAHIYSLFAWLPEIVRDRADATPSQAGALLALLALVGAPWGLLLPWVIVRYGHIRSIIYMGLSFFIVGYLGLLLAPVPLTWLWVAMAGSGPLLFAVCLTLINVRTRTHQGSVALSSFAQGVGYSVGALGPLVIGILHDITGGWVVPLVVLVVTGCAGFVAGAKAARPRFLEDELAARPVVT